MQFAGAGLSQENNLRTSSVASCTRDLNKAVNNHLQAINLLMRKFHNSRHFNVYDFTCAITRVRMKYARDVTPQKSAIVSRTLFRLTQISIRKKS